MICIKEEVTMGKYNKTDIMNLNGLSIDKYRQLKIKLLQKDFCIRLTSEQLSHFDSLSSDREIERYFFAILNQKIK